VRSVKSWLLGATVVVEIGGSRSRDETRDKRPERKETSPNNTVSG
jgi:hypothetical protein